MVPQMMRMLNKQFDNINEAAFLLGFFTLIAQVLGLLRDRLLASQFGAGIELDIYYTAFRIPDVLFAVAASLVSVTILIPFFVEKLKDGSEQRKAAREFLNRIFTSFFIGIILLSVIVFFLMPFIAKWIAPGFSSESLHDLILLSRIMLVSPILLGVSNLLGTITQTFKRFVVYALTPVFYNIGIVLGIVVFYPLFGFEGLAYGVILGAFLHLAIQLPVVIKEGLLPRFTFSWDWKEIGQVIKISFPRTLTLALSQIIMLVFFAIGSTMNEGAVSIFKLSFNIQSVPLALIGISYSVAAFPMLVQLFTNNNIKDFADHIVRPARQIIFWSIPVIIIFIVLRAHIVRVILGSGAFTWDDTRLTAATLALFVLSIIAQSLTLLLVRGYYAAGKTARPLVVSLFSAGTSIAFAYILLSLWRNTIWLQSFIERFLRVENLPGTEVLMLALAYSLGAVVNFFILWILFRKEFLQGAPHYLRTTFVQSLLGGLIIGGITFGLLRIFDNVFDINTFKGVFLQGFISGSMGIIVGITFLFGIKNREICAARDALRKRLWKTEIVGGDGHEGIQG